MAGDRSIKVTLRADVQDFKNQFDSAAKAAEKVGTASEQAGSKSTSVFGKLKQSAQDNRQEWTTAGTALTGFGAAILGVGAMAAKTGVAYNQLQQRAGSALEVLMGSAEAAAEQMAKLNEFADTSPFSREIFIEAQQQLIAFGVEAERVVPILSAVQDAVAATGGSNQDISELVDIIAKVGSTGKITAQTLNELGYRGVDAATIIGEQMGKTGQQIRDEITAGTLDADAAMQALTDGMSEKFGGAAAGMKETFDGAIDRLKAAWRDLSAELMVPLVSPDGGGFLVDLTNNAADALRTIQKLPEPVKYAGAAIGGLAGAASLGAGAFMLLFPRAMDTLDALVKLRLMSDKTASSLGRGAVTLGKYGLAIGAVATAVSALSAYGDSLTDFSLGANEAASMALKTADAVDPLQHVFAGMGEEAYIASASTDEMAKNLGVLANGSFWGAVSDKTAQISNAFGANVATLEDSRQRLGEYGHALTDLAATDLPKAQEAFRSLWDAFGGSDEAGVNLLKLMPEFRDHLVGLATDAGLATDEATLLRIATGEIGPAALGAADGLEGVAGAAEDVESAVEKATGAVNDHITALTDVGNAFLSARDAARKYEESLEDAYDLLDEYDGVTHWDDGTEAARRFEDAIDDVASAYLNEVETARANGDATAGIMQARRDDILALGEAYDIPKEELNSYLEMIGLAPEEIQQRVELETDEARKKWDEIYEEMWPEGGHPPMVIDADTDPAKGEVELFTGLLSDQPPTDVPVGADTSDAENEVHIFGSRIGDVPTTPVIVDADTYYGTIALGKFVDAVDGAGGTVEINGETLTADQALAALVDEINAGEGVVNINGIPTDAETALLQLVSHINGSEGVVTIEGNNDPAFSRTDEAKSKADNTTGTIDVDGNRSPADGKIDGVKSKADRTTGNVTVNASTGGAESAISRLIRPRRMTINVGYSDPGFKGSGGGSRFASGGPVFGPGTETSDSIHAMLSHNEHVFAAREVKAAGGHAGVYRIREQLLAGAKTIHLATGGAADGSVGAVQYAPANQQAGSQNVSASVDTGAITSAVRSGMQGMGVQLSLDGRTLYGAVVDAGQSVRRPFVTKGT